MDTRAENREKEIQQYGVKIKTGAKETQKTFNFPETFQKKTNLKSIQNLIFPKGVMCESNLQKNMKP